jgi:hypothetical protein
MKKKSSKSKDKGKLPGYPLYPANEDITRREDRLEGDIEDIIENTNPHAESKPNELDEEFNEGLKNRTTPADFSGSDLDVPGSELDDERELIGSEDEENNFYSLGGDNHEDLEERQD